MSENEATWWPSHDSFDLADSEPTAWLSEQLTATTVSQVRVSSLNLDFTLRDDPVNAEHVQVLAGVGDELPPIVVHEPSGRVIDGIHRVRASLSQGRKYISAILYEGSDEDAFVIAVRLNTAHGLPLSRAERSAAAERILRTHPQWSNRMIAWITGLSEATIRARRHDAVEPALQSRNRIGQDGRIRPVNAAEGRMRVSRLLAERPTASAREIARQAGVSPNTVLDVRRRLAQGQEAVPIRARAGGKDEAGRANQSTTAAAPLAVPRDLEKITETILVSLMADPSIRLSDRGRFLIRWMRANREALNSRTDVVYAIPERWSVPVAKLARAYAVFWQDLARRLEGRPEDSATHVVGSEAAARPLGHNDAGLEPLRQP
ncbi:ParB/RepB/Spo0J family partition protein [Streptomyces sp. RPT161]|uniref:ParB/RepB/Spo0J family partition protein n=1 Tax=Streptomyces sp. RPT161 TaxID=3015993 RepID=UPI0022B8DDA4|nr:hypothetical protein [Streptomyces sp. RPT161]